MSKKERMQNPETPDRVMGQVPQVHTDVENERNEGRPQAPRSEPSKARKEVKKPSKK